MIVLPGTASPRPSFLPFLEGMTQGGRFARHGHPSANPIPLMKTLRFHPKRPLGRAAAAALLLGIASCDSGSGDRTATDAAAVEGDDWVTVDLSEIYPIPQFIGTPEPTDVANLETTPLEPTYELRLPPGAADNVAFGKPVSSSDPYPIIGELDLVTDGDTHASGDTAVELGPDLQWVQIDLGQPHEIHVIHMWHHHLSPRVYLDVIVQISDQEEFENEDGTTADHVVTVWNADSDGSSGLGLPAGTDPAYVQTNHGRLVRANGVAGRYVRLYSNGNSGDPLNHYTEVMVYGKPVAGE